MPPNVGEKILINWIKNSDYRNNIVVVAEDVAD